MYSDNLQVFLFWTNSQNEGRATEDSEKQYVLLNHTRQITMQPRHRLYMLIRALISWLAGILA